MLSGSLSEFGHNLEKEIKEEVNSHLFHGYKHNML